MGTPYFSMCCPINSFLHEQLFWQSVLIFLYIYMEKLGPFCGLELVAIGGACICRFYLSFDSGPFLGHWELIWSL